MPWRATAYLWDLELAVQVLDDGHLGGVFLGVVCLENCHLLFVAKLDRLDGQPAALVLLNVTTDFADLFRGAKAVKVVVLDLEVTPHLHHDALRFSVSAFVGNASSSHAKRNRSVEGVVSAGNTSDHMTVQ